MDKLVIRKMEETDIEPILEVEAASFPDPWSKDILYQEIVKNSFAHYYVMLMDEKYIGYVGLWIVMDDAQITNIAILPAYRGRKLGEKLFDFAVKQAIQLGVRRLSLEVRVSNIAAQRMYQKFGLVPGGIRKNYYKNNQEDAIVMWVNLS
ncbi:ribosomal-protein-alanine N-acetyltransferase [Cerasibacillus terrae]|uniref:[Ribosomal protein bS18]-alanine N-acetyltransferase n=1 Tax=Cerasibacillus terrae TaxID=2498845 RepID=A0A5C8NWV3_9BACI|nr:ribosomal protein S18-alanine N-acetyltransferase [Cerasibacillus terrae]TXL65614.1 ribosomal-protein-alanine N-acetyltransferase [Cerasibacillus terrae]